jgi:hypothetical protein
LEALQEEWPKIRRNFGSVSRDLVALGREVGVFRSDVQSSFHNVNEFVEEIGIQIQLINTRPGEDGPASDYADSTIWEASEKFQNMATRASHAKWRVLMGKINGLEALILSQSVSMDTVK